MQSIENKTFDEINIGDTASLTRRLTLQDIKLMTAVSGDLDPEVLNEDYVRQIPTDGVTVPSLWSSSIISSILENQLPGPGTRIIDLSIHFVAPITLGQIVTLTLRAKRKAPSNNQITFGFLGTDCNGEPVLEGEAITVALNHKIRREATEIPEINLKGRPHLRLLLEMVSRLNPLRTAVVHPTQTESLSGAIEAAKANLIEPVLVGPEEKIIKAATELDIDLSPWTIVPAEHSHEAAWKAVELARAGKVDALMKGSLHTDELMHAVLDRETGLRTDRRMSHVFAFDVPTYPRALLITDAAINIYPTLEDKKDILQNAIDLALALHIRKPKVAILSAVETVNPNIQSTVEAAALCKMADRGQITGGLIDGPLAFDNAVSEAAAKTKGIVSPVAGKADILLVPDVESGNMLAKQLEYLGGAEGAGVVVGARVPIILTSRSDDTTSRMASCAIAVLQSHKMQLRKSRSINRDGGQKHAKGRTRKNHPGSG